MNTMENATASKRDAGFTLIELLVVVVIIVVLAAFSFPAFGRARENANRVKCMSNLRQLGVSILLMTADNGGWFPLGQGGNWPWDVPRKVTDPMITKYGATRELFYCPAQPGMNQKKVWEFSPNFRPIGYVFLIKGVPQIPPERAQENMHENLMPAAMKTRRNILPEADPPASKVELVVDAILSQNGNYKNVTGGNAINRSNHMDAKMTLPTGANILFKDGHTEWRDFSKMAPTEKFGNPQFQY